MLLRTVEASLVNSGLGLNIFNGLFSDLWLLNELVGVIPAGNAGRGKLINDDVIDIDAEPELLWLQE